MLKIRIWGTGMFRCCSDRIVILRTGDLRWDGGEFLDLYGSGMNGSWEFLEAMIYMIYVEIPRV
jgi:hypothetical protein